MLATKRCSSLKPRSWHFTTHIRCTENSYIFSKFRWNYARSWPHHWKINENLVKVTGKLVKRYNFHYFPIDSLFFNVKLSGWNTGFHWNLSVFFRQFSSDYCVLLKLVDCTCLSWLHLSFWRGFDEYFGQFLRFTYSMKKWLWDFSPCNVQLSSVNRAFMLAQNATYSKLTEVNLQSPFREVSDIRLSDSCEEWWRSEQGGLGTNGERDDTLNLNQWESLRISENSLEFIQFITTEKNQWRYVDWNSVNFYWCSETVTDSNLVWRLLGVLFQGILKVPFFCILLGRNWLCWKSNKMSIEGSVCMENRFVSHYILRLKYSCWEKKKCKNYSL